jgi:hypothetical protein
MACDHGLFRVYALCSDTCRIMLWGNYGESSHIDPKLSVFPKGGLAREKRVVRYRGSHNFPRWFKRWDNVVACYDKAGRIRDHQKHRATRNSSSPIRVVS